MSAELFREQPIAEGVLQGIVRIDGLAKGQRRFREVIADQWRLLSLR
jgi:hypothetical protein